MQASNAPLDELLKAKYAIDSMQKSEDLDEFEEFWKLFLSRLERCVNKARAHYQKSPKWDSWWGKYNKLRLKDPLLSYLVYARGADEHTVEDIVDREGAGFCLNSAPGEVLHISRASMIDGVLVVKSPNEVRVAFIPARIVLKDIVNRGRRYTVPMVHLGTPVNARDVISLACLGYHFYDKFLSDANDYFVK